ncbi:hypothetical protein [Variovorax ginsengisoli]|uniref:Bacteriophage tail tape measure N-terminal domain-containing protein n=1 Tax=Variovorax ginsengisoli TaxID=363844 RepID=A0ABT9SFP2_9BURK|nr:hypothetical protein [Variovorax ginsengisoli]MDP9902611.1 hypothetical protein [Variovorax ginsengisoli]
MSNENKTGFVVEGDESPFRAAMRRLVDSARDGESGVGAALGKLVSPIGLVQTALAGLATVLTAGFLHDTVKETADMTEGATNLSRQLGVAATNAQAYIVALAGKGGEQNDFVAAARGIAKQLKENEEQMNKMGLATRDAAGNLRPLNEIVVDGIATLNGYKEGTDRAMASAVVFGKGVDTSSRLFLLNKEAVEEAAETVERYRLEIGTNSVAAYEAYDQATDTAGYAVLGLKKAMGDALMPVVTDLINMFNAVVPAAIVVTRLAVGTLVAAFYGLVNGVVIVGETINAVVINIAEPIRALGVAIYKTMTGDFRGAADEIRNIGTVVNGAWSTAMDNMVASSTKTATKINALFSRDSVSAPAVNEGTKTYVAPPEKAKKEKKEAEPSLMKEYETRLNGLKLSYERENTMREFNKDQELTYWQQLLSRQDLYAKDRAAIALKVSRLEVQILRDGARDAQDIQSARNQDAAAATAAHVAELQARSQAERDLGLITQAEFLEREKAFNAQRLQAELDFIALKIGMAQLDPEKNVVLLEQLELQKLEIRRKYNALNAEVARAQVAEQATPMLALVDQIQQGLGGMTNALLGNWRSLGSSLLGVLQGIGRSIIQETILKPLAAKVVAAAKERLLSLTTIGANAAEAGSGAAASQASIPYIGPILAIAAMAAVFAAVAGMAGKVPSAAGGFDIPSGLNPMTQLHEEEMVLPADLANPLRQMARGGGAGGGGVGASASPAVIRGMPPGEWLMLHRGDLVKALGSSQRDFMFKGF